MRQVRDDELVYHLFQATRGWTGRPPQWAGLG
jgi:hypothetical protein